MFQPAPSPRFSDSTTRTSGEPLPDERDRAVARAVVDDDDLRAAHALEALLDPRQGVVRDDDDRGVVSHARPAAASLCGGPPRA